MSKQTSSRIYLVASADLPGTSPLLSSALVPVIGAAIDWDWLLVDVVLLLVFSAVDLFIGSIFVSTVVILKETFEGRRHTPLELVVALLQDLVALAEVSILGGRSAAAGRCKR